MQKGRDRDKARKKKYYSDAAATPEAETEVLFPQAKLAKSRLAKLNDARNVWLTEFYFAGMHVIDCLLLKCEDFQNGRLYYQMSKNGEHSSVIVPGKALAIIRKPPFTCSHPTTLIEERTKQGFLLTKFSAVE